MKDGTAQGVAKARHYEAMWPPEKRLFHDPYARGIYPGGFVQQMLGTGLTRWLYTLLGPGNLEMLLERTRWLDDEVKTYAAEAKNLIILGAGYDTRGYRLDLPPELAVWEVDQPAVQKQKLARMEAFASKDSTVAERMNHSVHYVPVDFNADDLSERLRSAEGFEEGQLSVVTLEGVTQYIPKESTFDTLRKLRSLVAPGSVVLVSYVDQNVRDNPTAVGPARSIKSLVNLAGKVGEPWISMWAEEAFRQDLDAIGYEVLSNTTCKDYNDSWLAPLGRSMKPEEITSAERFVVARVK